MNEQAVLGAAKAQSELTLWSASSWATWKQCPLKFRIKNARWENPEFRSDTRTAVMAVPGLVVDRLFELWLYRDDFEDLDWLKGNFAMVWAMIRDKRKPKWLNADEEERIRQQTQRSVLILFDLLHKHDLFGEKRGIQTDFHMKVSPRIAIAGAIDLWVIRRDGKLVVVDFKNFGSNSNRSIDQLHFYAMALEKLLGRIPEEAGYVCFHPAYAGHRNVVLRPCDRNKLMVRLERATEQRAAGFSAAKYNEFLCPRFCEVRFGCAEFVKRVKGKVPGATD
jgi:hypothetical protein